MLLALVPSAATSPGSRLLIFAGLGGMGLLARFLAAWFEKSAWLPDKRRWRGLAHVTGVILIPVHLIAAPLLLPITSLGMAGLYTRTIEKPYVALAREVDPADKSIVLINPPIPQICVYVQFISEKFGFKQPLEIHALKAGVSYHLTVRRVAPNALEIEPKDGFITNDLEKILRGPATPMHLGQQIKIGTMQAEVLSLTEDQRPLRMKFSFDDPLDDPSLLFYQWKRDRFVPFTLPESGRTVVIETRAATG